MLTNTHPEIEHTADTAVPTAPKRPSARTQAEARAAADPRQDEEEQLRTALHMVLGVGVYDGAGRSVTVQEMLRGSLATLVRAALNGRRSA